MSSEDRRPVPEYVTLAADVEVGCPYREGKTDAYRVTVTYSPVSDIIPAAEFYDRVQHFAADTILGEHLAAELAKTLLADERTGEVVVRVTLTPTEESRVGLEAVAGTVKIERIE